MKKAKVFIGLVAILLLMSNYAFSQPKCMFLVKSTSFSAGDQILYDKLVEWGYDVTPTASADLDFLFLDEITAFDFAFVSESIGSGDLAKGEFKTVPIPLANLEGWAVKPGAMDWQTDRDVNNYPPEPVKIVDNTGHPLAAGFATGATVTIVSDVTNGLIVGSVPQIPIIPIAVMSSDETKQVIYGIEAGTQNALGDTIQSRVATVGIHEFGYPSMTDDAWKFVKAAIDWVLTEPTGIAEEQIMPAQYELAQNYPNPFNPTTQIHYTLGKNTNVEIAVYDLLGQKVATLVNAYQNAGSYKVVWDASEISVGVYLYQMKTNDFVESKKMILVK